MSFCFQSNTNHPQHPLDMIESLVTREGTQVNGQYNGLRLTSAFQPIFSIPHRRQVGYEGLLRAFNPDGTAVSPLEVFHTPRTESDAILLDRLCRNLHLRNFMTMADDTHWIFINISPQVIVNGKHYGAYFSGLLQRYGIPPHRVVIEILEGDIHDEDLLADAVDYYKKLGCLIAIDDFGAGHSNFERIWRIGPDIVKLDRSVITQAAQNRSVARVLPNLVNLIHESGSLALIEGVETENEALVAMNSGSDFVQGFYFGKPSEQLIPLATENHRIIELCGKFKTYSDDLEHRQKSELVQYMETFMRSAELVQSGFPVEHACAGFLDQERAERCFLLNRDGIQSDKNIVSPSHEKRKDLRFLPVSNAEGGNWSKRHYFRHALNNHGEIQTTQPYLSVVEAHLCITLSIAIQTNNDTSVLCCDLNWEDT